MNMETNAERRRRKLTQLCGERGLKNIAYRAELNPATLDQIIKGVMLPPKKDGSRSQRNLGDEAARRIEDAEGLGRGWFDEPEVTAFVTNIPKIDDPSAGNEDVLLVGLNKSIPRIAWDEIQGFIQGMFKPPQDRYEIVSSRNVAPRCFMLEVNGEAMLSPAPTENIPSGTMLVCDPDQPAQPGHYVIALHPKSGEPVFRRLVKDAGVWFLRPNNPAYPLVEIDGPSAVVARVVKIRMEMDV